MKKPADTEIAAPPRRRTRSILPRASEMPGAEDAGNNVWRRDRLLASIALIMGAGVLVAVPFALRAGAEFFLPVTAALVIAIALVPPLEWMERRRVPSSLAAFFCLMLFLIIANAAVAAIVFPASEWVKMLPERIDRVRTTLAPIIEAFSDLDSFIQNVAHEFSRGPGLASQTVTVETPNSLLQIIATSAPFALIQMFFATLVIYFFLAGWTKMRKRTITNRASFDGAMTTARVIQQVVDATSTYLGTITVVNICLGLLVGLILWGIGMESPLMWGGIVAVLNFIPYLGPIGSALLLFMGGLMTFPGLVGAAPATDLHRAAHGRSESDHAHDRWKAADDQPAGDPRVTELLGMGVGDHGRAAGGASADHHEDDLLGRRYPGYRRLPVRTRHFDACGRGGSGKRAYRC